MAKTKAKANPGTMKRVLGYIGKYKYLLPLSIIFAFITVALTLYIPVLIGEAIDLIGIWPIDFREIVRIFNVGAVLIGITALSQWLMSAINNKITYGVVRDIRRDAFHKIEELPLSYLDSHSRGDIVNRVINDADQFTEGLLLGFTQLFTGILTIVGTLVFMLTMNWVVAIVVVTLTPLSLFIAKFIATRTYNMFRLRSECEGAQTAYIEEAITNQKLIKAFSREDEAQAGFDEVNERLSDSTKRAIFFSSLTNPTTRFVYAIVYAAVALTGAVMAISAGGGTVLGITFSVGQLAALLAYANQYTKPFNEISGVITEFQNSLACASRVFELIEADSEIPDKDGAKVLSNVSGNVELKDVFFSYTDDKPLIENVNLKINPGERVAIVGPTGCGKTTLINLLMRFYDVRSGAILVEENDIRDLTRDSLRESYGMVLQDTYLFHGTVKKNISIGNPDATDEKIIAAAKAAHAHGFIKRLPNGYDTVIEEGGENLSLGQRQLLAIARIMLSPPPMLILDEATSSIDTRTEMKIQDAFSELMRGRTSFIVAHRLSTVIGADLIIVMKDGHIIETGNHSELMKKNGFYSELFNSQFAH